MNTTHFIASAPELTMPPNPFVKKAPPAQLRVMLVDQDLHVATILKKVLSPEFELIAIPNGMEAMTWLEKGNIPDMIISEIHVPHLDGGQLLQVVRNSNLFQHIPFMMLSTQDDSSTRIKCLDNGADGYLIKPFNPMEVKAKAKAILRRIYHYRD